MSGKLIPRTELLAFCRTIQPSETSDLYRVWQDLECGRVIGLNDWGHASAIYTDHHTKKGAKGDSWTSTLSEKVSGAEVHRVPLAGEVWAVDDALLAHDEQVADTATNRDQQGDAPGPADNGETNAPEPGRGQVLGSYRLQTPSGPVIFTAVQGARSVEIFVAQGLNLPGKFGDLEIARSVEFGKAINFDNIKELINAK